MRADFRQWIPRSPQALLVTNFAGMILVGTVLLALPWAHQSGGLHVLDALFTATSAVCVTGLSVVSTGQEFTLFGQIVILLLIQAGGLGVMTFAGLAAVLLGGRLSLKNQAALTDSLFQRDTAVEFRRLFLRIVKLTFLIEGAGALLLFLFMLLDKPAGHSLYSALFHAVSAFCNAGFSLYDDSFTGLRGNPGVMTVLSLLIVFGGLGHIVLVELWALPGKRKKRGQHWLSHHGKIVMGMTAILLVGGALLLFGFGQGPGADSAGARLGAALFQSVTARTAGFNTVDIGRLPLASLFVVILLMFIGGSPGSCAGGVKTTTLAIWLARLKCRLTGRSDTVLLGRMVPVDVVRRVSVLMGLALIWNAVGLLVLLGLEQGAPGIELKDLLFEQVSAFATVGLSTGVTAKLGWASELWIVLTMFVGRLGPLTIALWAIPLGQNRISYPEGKVMIG